MFLGAPDTIRTCDTEIRNLVLYPPELRGHNDLRASMVLIVTVFVTIWASRYSCCLWAASLRSVSLTMLYRSNTALVLCPEIIIATLSGIPDRTMLRTAILLKSWKSFIPAPPFLQAVFHALSNRFTLSVPSSFRNTKGMVVPNLIRLFHCSLGTCFNSSSR
jgi:hypothetical protein